MTHSSQPVGWLSESSLLHRLDQLVYGSTTGIPGRAGGLIKSESISAGRSGVFATLLFFLIFKWKLLANAEATGL